jgi:hypothetical protein
MASTTTTTTSSTTTTTVQHSFTLNYTGRIETVPSEIAHLMAAGDQVRGSYTFDPNAAPTEVSETRAWYPLMQMTVEIVGRGISATCATPNPFGIGVSNDEFGEDRYSVSSSGCVVQGPEGLGLMGIGFTLADDDQTAFASEALPLSIDVGEFEHASLGVGFHCQVPLDCFVGASLDAISPAN